MRAWLCAAIILAAGLSCASAGADDAAGRVLAESDFSFDMDGWEVDGDAGARDAAHMSKMIKAGDDGADEWYFVAPHKFTGSKREAYGGSLLFRHGFFEFNRSAQSAGVRDCLLTSPVLTRGGCASSDGKDTQRGFDVLISSDAHGLTIGRQGLFPAWSFSSDHKLELIESAGWLVTDTNQPPRSFSARERLSYFRMHHRVTAIFLPLYEYLTCTWLQPPRDGETAVENQQHQDPRRDIRGQRGCVHHGCQTGGGAATRAVGAAHLAQDTSNTQ
jgi:hypothetical protein